MDWSEITRETEEDQWLGLQKQAGFRNSRPGHLREQRLGGRTGLERGGGLSHSAGSDGSRFGGKARRTERAVRYAPEVGRKGAQGRCPRLGGR